MYDMSLIVCLENIHIMRRKEMDSVPLPSLLVAVCYFLVVILGRRCEVLHPIRIQLSGHLSSQ